MFVGSKVIMQYPKSTLSNLIRLSYCFDVQKGVILVPVDSWEIKFVTCPLFNTF